MDSIDHRCSSDAAPLDCHAPRVGLAKKQKSRRTNDPLAAANGNTAHGRRVRDLAHSYLAALGSPEDVGIQAAAVAAAELVALVEQKRAEALAQPGMADLDALVRLENLADRKVRKLGIKPSAPQASRSVRDQLMGRR